MKLISIFSGIGCFALLLAFCWAPSTIWVYLASGWLGVAGLGFSLWNYRMRRLISLADADLNVVEQIGEERFAVHRNNLRAKAEDGVFAGLLLASFGGIVHAFGIPVVEAFTEKSHLEFNSAASTATSPSNDVHPQTAPPLRAPEP